MLTCLLLGAVLSTEAETSQAPEPSAQLSVRSTASAVSPFYIDLSGGLMAEKAISTHVTLALSFTLNFDRSITTSAGALASSAVNHLAVAFEPAVRRLIICVRKITI